MRAVWFVLSLSACAAADPAGEPVPLDVRVMDLKFGTPLEAEVCVRDVTCRPAVDGVASFEVPGDQRLVVEVTAEGDFVPSILALAPAASDREVAASLMGRVWLSSLGSAVDAVNDGTFASVRYTVTDAAGAPLAGATAGLSDAVGTGPVYVESDGVRVADGASATTDAGWGLWFDLPAREDLVLTVDHTGDCDAAGGWTGAEVGEVELALEAGFQSQVDVVCL